MYYVIDEKGNVTPTNDREEWGRCKQNEKLCRVGSTTVGKVWISTVFLGIDHQFGKGQPLLFETMVFEDPNKSMLEVYCEQYSTIEQARAGHTRVVELVKQS
jgi:hypothetical protein